MMTNTKCAHEQYTNICYKSIDAMFCYSIGMQTIAIQMNNEFLLAIVIFIVIFQS